MPVLSTEELRSAVVRLPRITLAHLPTPLEEARRFAAHIEGPRLFVKRDDCTGMLMGGNKTRHNEFLLAQAMKQGADVLVWARVCSPIIAGKPRRRATSSGWSAIST